MPSAMRTRPSHTTSRACEQIDLSSREYTTDKPLTQIRRDKLPLLRLPKHPISIGWLPYLRAPSLQTNAFLHSGKKKAGQESTSTARSPTPEESDADEIPPPSPQGGASGDQGVPAAGGDGGGGEGITQAEVDEAWERARAMEVSRGA